MTKRNPTPVEKIKCFSDFITDGCDMADDMVLSDSCNEHDLLYSTGEVSRAEADNLLRKSVASKGFPVLAWVCWLGVRMFGWVTYYFGISYRIRIQYQDHVANCKASQHKD